MEWGGCLWAFQVRGWYAFHDAKMCILSEIDARVLPLHIHTHTHTYTLARGKCAKM